MTIFKTFFKIMLKYKFIIIMYTSITIFFAGMGVKSNSTETDFSVTKPRIYIVNNDESVGITNDIIEYLKQKCEIADLENSKQSIDDAIFYRDVDYVIYIPQNFRADFIAKKNPQIEIKQTGSYGAELAKMNFERYLKVARQKVQEFNNEDELISEIHKVIDTEAEVELKEKIDTAAMAKLSRYFSFASYSILAVAIYVLATILAVFKEQKVSKRTNISSLHYKKFNRSLFIASSTFGIFLWMIFTILAIVITGNGVFTINGIFYIANMFIFIICAVCMSVFIGNIIKNKNAANAMVNIIALGSSFLCGAFVPAQYLPDFVLKIAHVLPSYWYINTNGIIENCSNFSGDALKSIIINMVVLIGFSILFVILTNWVSRKFKTRDGV